MEHRWTAADLRALRARARVPAYRVAAEAQIAPTTLFAVLSERRPLDVQLAHQIADAIQRLADLPVDVEGNDAIS